MRRAARILAPLLLALCWAAGAASAADAPPQAEHAHEHPTAPAESPAAARKPAPAGKTQTGIAATAAVVRAGQTGQAGQADLDAGVVERLGEMAALDVELLGENGQRLRLRDLVTMPTILAPVYYSCPNECNVLLGTLAQVLPQVGLKPGEEYQVLAVSFDDRDTPATATKRKGDFLNTTAAGFPPQAWRFLSGDEANVRRLMDSVGFGYQRSGDAFRHSIVLVALTPTGKISRYLYGIRPLAFDIALAATEAGAEKTGLSVKRAIAMCYTYDPQGRRYVFDFMKVAGAGVLFALAIFGLFLAYGGKRRGAPPKT